MVCLFSDIFLTGVWWDIEIEKIEKLESRGCFSFFTEKLRNWRAEVAFFHLLAWIETLLGDGKERQQQDHRSQQEGCKATCKAKASTDGMVPLKKSFHEGRLKAKETSPKKQKQQLSQTVRNNSNGSMPRQLSFLIILRENMRIGDSQKDGMSRTRAD